MTHPMPCKPRRGSVHVRTRSAIRMTKSELRKLLMTVYADAYVHGFGSTDAMASYDDPLRSKVEAGKRREYVEKIMERYQ